MIRSPYELDRAIGMLYYYIDEPWPPLGARVPRPDGFVVVEEVSGTPCTRLSLGDVGDRYVYLMEKRGVDHYSAVRVASRALGARVHFLGMKDSNALTYQLVYTFRPGPREWSDGRVSLKFIGMASGRLEHTGNEFIVTLEGDTGGLRDRASRLAEAGAIPAYFGYQRFGLTRPNSHLVGRAIVSGNLKEAVDLLLGRPFPSEPERWKEFRRLYDQGDLREALRVAPRPEAMVLRELMSSGDPARALRRYPASPSFFIEAYQSYVFNLCLSRALELNEVPPAIRVPRRASDAEGVCREVMASEGVTDLSSAKLGAYARDMVRPSMMQVRDLAVEGNRLSFSLARGMYATVVLRELLRQEPLLFAV